MFKVYVTENCVPLGNFMNFKFGLFIAMSWSVRASVSNSARRSLIEIARKIIFISKSSQTFLCLVLQSSFVLLFSSFFALIVVFLTLVLVLVVLSEITGELILKFLTVTRIFLAELFWCIGACSLQA